jgi:thioesterase domain-containing protein
VGGAGIETATQKAANLAPAPYTPQRIGRAIYRRTRRTLKSGWGVLTQRDELSLQVQAELVERACYIADGAYRAVKFPDEVMVLHSRDSPERSSDWDPVANVREHLTIDVGHYTMFFEPDVDVLSREIMSRLNRSD